MDPSSVLLALEEQKKWRVRRERLRDRLKQLERRRAYLEKELARVRTKVSHYRGLVSAQTSISLPDRPPVIPPQAR